MQHFIFGYGSLFSTESRANTANVPHAIPAVLNDYKRGWYFHDAEGYTALGITEQVRSTTNGVLVSVQKDQLPEFDMREGGYDRVLVPHNKLASGEKGVFKPEDKIWTYVVKNIQKPTQDHPIVQTYLDLTLIGCLEHGETTAREFVDTTHAWSRHWINDRRNPIFKRCLKYAPHTTLDTYLTPILGIRKDYADERCGVCN